MRPSPIRARRARQTRPCRMKRAHDRRSATSARQDSRPQERQIRISDPGPRQSGNVATATVGTIQRRLLVLENQGATKFFGEPALDVGDCVRLDQDGRGVINILAADKLMRSPRLYATFLLWLLSELFEQMPE